ncbi:type II secretion system protein [bacterium]|nr:MAG: type II secretion system protein [bacterium]
MSRNKKNLKRHDAGRSQRGFTLIELLVVIAIIGLLASAIVPSLNASRAKSRDARRIMDMNQMGKALTLYYDANNAYPDSDMAGCGGWDTPGNGTFITALKTAGYIARDILDPTTNGTCGNYAYYRYPAGSYGCDASRGAFYVLGIRDMETSAGTYPGSQGWSCPSRDWQGEFEWVLGEFEK